MQYALTAFSILIQLALAIIAFKAGIYPRYARKHKKSLTFLICGLFVLSASVSIWLGHIAEVANQKIQDSVDGGDAYAYVAPQDALMPMPLVIWNDKQYALNGVSLMVWRTADKQSYPFKFYDVGVVPGKGVPKPLPIMIAPNLQDVEPDTNGNRIDNYVIQITAQNGFVIQRLQFKKSACEASYAYRYSVYKLIDEASEKNLKTTTSKILLDRDWSDAACIKNQAK